MDALKWPKENNPHYCNVKIDESWLDKFQNDPLYGYVADKADTEMCEEMHLDNTVENCHLRNNDIDGDHDATEPDGTATFEKIDEEMEEANLKEAEKGNTDMREEMHLENTVENVVNLEKDRAAEEENVQSIKDFSNNCHAGDDNIDDDHDTITSDATAACDDDDDDDDSESEKIDEEMEEANLKEDQKELERKGKITVEPSSTCIQIDDIEQAVFSIAPGQNSVSKFILLDEDFEHLAFSNYFPGGFGRYDVLQPRRSKLDLRRYVNQRLLNVKAHFSQDIDFIFAFQYATELQQLKSEMKIALKKTLHWWRKYFWSSQCRKHEEHRICKKT